jgi:choline dehydrogenase-like flavoprotein
MAWHAARAGLSTIVVEKGPRVQAQDMSSDELRMIPRLYKDGGMQMSSSLDLFILQGNCVGGSTLLSNMVLLRADQKVFERWRSFGAAIDDASMQHSYDTVEKDLGAAVPHPHNISETTRRFVDSARQLGRDPKWMLKALGDCVGCGLCNVGCSFDTKQSSQASHLAWAEAQGARVLDSTDVVRVLHNKGVALGLEAVQGRGKERVCITARVIVIAAGAIGSSALLLRSGIRRNVGTRLSFNAASAVTADFSDVVDGFDADQMTAYLLGQGWLLEATHNPLMSAALTTPGWGADHGDQMRRTRHLAYVGSIVPTEPVGKVVWSPWFGHEEVVFHMPESDLRNLEAGLREAARILLNAGAQHVSLPLHQLRRVSRQSELDDVRPWLSSAKDFAMGSAHPQGGNPISDDPARGVVDSDLRVHGFDNLFVCDASVFPSSVGVNPLDTIFALVQLAAPKIAQQA